MRALAAAVRSNRFLHTMNISGCDLDDIGALHVAKMVHPGEESSNLSVIHTLNLRNNPFGAGGVAHIARALRPNKDGYSNKRLTRLDLSSVEAKVRGMRELAEMLAENKVPTTQHSVIQTNPRTFSHRACNTPSWLNGVH